VNSATHLECARCGNTYDLNRPVNTCSCGSPLLVRYDLDNIASRVDRQSLALGSTDMWRYKEFLPVPDESITTLGEGMTPLLSTGRLGECVGLRRLYMKDEGLNPTGTFKARGASCGISMAAALGVDAVALPTAGNAGGAWAAYAARAGIRCVVAMPDDAPRVTQVECDVYGADACLVPGLISDAGKVIARGASERGWFEVATLKEPYRIEGKKTMGLEIMEQCDWRMPDVIVYPTGGGVGLIGIWKSFAELEAIGWIGEERPRMIAVQAHGCDPIVRAFQAGARESEFRQGARTLAGGIRVPKALGDFLVLDALYESGGAAIAVSDESILEALRLVARVEGMFICPEGAAAVAAVRQLTIDGEIDGDESVIVLNTGSGLKYTELIECDLPGAETFS